MRAALATFDTQPQPDRNLTVMLDLMTQATSGGAQLIVFAEAALSGFVFTGRDADADHTLAVAVDGPELGQLIHAARQLHLWVALGFLERQGEHLFDAAVLIDPARGVVLHYHRVSPGWRWPDAPAEYCDGQTVPSVATPFGRVALLLCGDAFHAGAAALATAQRPDLLLLPFARGFDEDAPTEAAWTQERQLYAETLARIAPRSLAVNALGPTHVGGAFHTCGPDVIDFQSLHRPGLLFVDWEHPSVPAHHLISSPKEYL